MPIHVLKIFSLQLLFSHVVANPWALNLCIHTSKLALRLTIQEIIILSTVTISLLIMIPI